MCCSFIFRFSKRNTMLPPHVILAVTKSYGEVLATCCGKGEAEAQTCFDTKVRRRLRSHPIFYTVQYF